MKVLQNSLYFLSMLFAFSQCGSRHFLLEEKFLFDSNSMETWWLVNTIPRLESPQNLASSQFITITKEDNKCYSEFYLADFSNQTYYNYLNCPKAIYSYNKFPVSLIIPYGDSSSSNGFWKFDRNNIQFRIRSVGNYKNTNQRIFYNNVKPFKGSFGNDSLGIIHFIPLKSNFNSNANNPNSTTFIHRFDQGSFLLQMAKSNEVLLADLVLKNGETLSILFVKNKDGNCRILSCNYLDSLSVKINADFHIQQFGETVIGPYSSKQYSINFKGVLNGLEFEIHPVRLDQEFNQKKISFWLGQIHLIDKRNNLVMGQGVLYNLKQ